MSTRATYTFKGQEDWEDDHTVYVHCDGYPSEALKKIQAAIPLAWELPRYESDEFAASFVAANKNNQGNIRLMKSPENSGDAEYDYSISVSDDHKLMVDINPRNHQEDKEYGELCELMAKHC